MKKTRGAPGPSVHYEELVLEKLAQNPPQDWFLTPEDVARAEEVVRRALEVPLTELLPRSNLSRDMLVLLYGQHQKT